MPNIEIKCDVLPPPYRDGFEQLAQALAELAGENLLGLSAFGGWAISDPFFANTSARGVAVLKDIDLRMIDRLASSGAKFGKKNVSAPLLMTPEYIAASCDVFPLELLEIQQSRVVVCGEDHFGELKFERRDVRLQCEREFKGELIQLRQGLLAVAGRHKLLGELCLAVTERTLRVLRGLIYLADPATVAKTAADVIAQAAGQTDITLGSLERITARGSEIGLADFERLYGEIKELASYADRLED